MSRFRRMFAVSMTIIKVKKKKKNKTHTCALKSSQMTKRHELKGRQKVKNNRRLYKEDDSVLDDAVFQ